MRNKLDLALREVEQENNIKGLKQVSQEVSKKYMASFSGGTPLVKTKEQTLAYSIIRMRATFAACNEALSQISDGEDIRCVLDVGSGTGAGILACYNRFGFSSIDAVELEAEMINLSKTIIGKIDKDLLNKVNYISKDATKLDFNKKYDVVFTSYFLNELKKEDRICLVKKLYDAATRYLVIVEPGTPNNHKEMMEIKNIICSLGGRIVAPCKRNDCPLLDTDDWCHFKTRVQRSSLGRELKGGTKGYEDEKYTFLVVLKDGKVKTNYTNRIIRDIVYGKGKVMVRVCTPNGIETKTISKSQKEMYKAIKNMKIGDEF